MEQYLTGPNLIFLGMMIWSGMLLKSAAGKSKQSRNRDVSKELKAELRKKQRSAESQIHQLEVRLHDYDRDVAARVETTMTMLDQLILEADQEIVRLETLLEHRRAATLEEVSCDLEPDQRRMVVHLAGAGYSISEIARLTDRPAEGISEVLNQELENRRAA